MEKMVFIGAGSHFHRVLDSFDGAYEIAGVLDNLLEVGTTIEDIPALGGFALIPELAAKGIRYVFISIGDLGLRKKLLLECSKYDLKLISIIDPTAIVSKRAQLRSGVFVGKGAIVNAYVTIGKASIINSGSVVEHDCTIGSNVHIAPNATLCGNVTVQDDSFVGAGSVVLPGIKIGKEAIVGANATVLEDVLYQSKVVGSPARNIL